VGGTGAAGLGGSAGGEGGAAAAEGGNGGSGPVRSPLAGELVITEIMPNPDDVTDETGEWFEVKNVTTDHLSLDGCRLKDLDIDEHVIAATNVVVAPGQVALFAKNADPSVNGGLPTVACAFGQAYSLTNSDDELILECGGAAIDEVCYTSAWPFDVGVSMELRTDHQNALDNDLVGNWCLAAGTYGATDRGSPGTADPHCQ
jgi:hypothetical protein